MKEVLKTSSNALFPAIEPSSALGLTEENVRPKSVMLESGFDSIELFARACISANVS
jgi:hypothetical protein